MAKFIGESRLTYLWSKIKAWVQNYASIQSVTGKDTITMGNSSIDVYDWAQASTKPSYTQDEVGDGDAYKRFSASEKTKLSGIASGAEVNQNAFSKVKVTTSGGTSTSIDADAKADTLEIVAGTNITITPDATNDKITISASDQSIEAATATPEMDGTAAVGSSTKYAREDHVHPSDTSKANVSTTVTNVAWDGTNKKLTKTINGTTTDVVTASTLKSGLSLSKSDVGLGNVTNDAQIPIAQKGVANGVCPLDANARIDAQYLPSFVDDVIEAYIREGQTALSSTWLASGSASGVTIVPETGKIYVIMNGTDSYPTNSQYRWAGSAYVKLNDGGMSEMSEAEMDTATSNWS